MTVPIRPTSSTASAACRPTCSPRSTPPRRARAPPARTSSTSAWATRTARRRRTSSPSWSRRCRTRAPTAIRSARASPACAGRWPAITTRRFGVQLDPETEVIATLGSKEGLANLAAAITSPGDTILVPNPSYPIHQFGFIIAGAAVRRIPATPDEDMLRGAGPRGAPLGAEADRADRQFSVQPDGVSRRPRLLPRDRRLRPPARDLDHVRPRLCRDLFRRQRCRRRSCRCRAPRTSPSSSPPCRRPTPCPAGAWASPPATRG